MTGGTLAGPEESTESTTDQGRSCFNIQKWVEKTQQMQPLLGKKPDELIMGMEMGRGARCWMLNFPICQHVFFFRV